MSGRRLIGIDLAWGKRDGSEPAGSGCAELVWKGGELELTRLCILRRVDEIVKWIQPDDGDWVVAIDAPLVICSKCGQRPAEKQARHYYGGFDANARPAYLKNPNFRKHYQGRMIRKRLKELGGTLVERAEHLDGGPLFFETYPHIAMVELFRLKRTIKYKGDNSADRLAGQWELTCAIWEYLCHPLARPRLVADDKLAALLCEPGPLPRGEIVKRVKSREDKLDALVCAYTAAWLDAGRPLQGLGEVGKGVMITPRRRDIAPPLR